MRLVIVTAIVLGVGCQKTKPPDECDRVVDHVLEVKRAVSNKPADQWEREVASWRAEMAPHCRAKFTADDRACMLAVETLDDLGRCNAAISSRQPARTPDR